MPEQVGFALRTAFLAVYLTSYVVHIALARFGSKSFVSWSWALRVGLNAAIMALNLTATGSLSVLSYIIPNAVVDVIGEDNYEDLQIAGAMTMLYATTPFILAALHSPGSSLLMARYIAAYIFFLPTVVSDLFSYSIARFDDISWGTKAVGVGASAGTSVASPTASAAAALSGGGGKDAGAPLDVETGLLAAAAAAESPGGVYGGHGRGLGVSKLNAPRSSRSPRRKGARRALLCDSDPTCVSTSGPTPATATAGGGDIITAAIGSCAGATTAAMSCKGDSGKTATADAAAAARASRWVVHALAALQVATCFALVFGSFELHRAFRQYLLLVGSVLCTTGFTIMSLSMAYFMPHAVWRKGAGSCCFRASGLLIFLAWLAATAAVGVLVVEYDYESRYSLWGILALYGSLGFILVLAVMRLLAARCCRQKRKKHRRCCAVLK